MKREYILIALLIVQLVASSPTFAYDDEISHPEMTRKAIKFANIDRALQENIGFAKGTESKLNGIAIVDIVTKGSSLEDRETCRRSNHFHNPLEADWLLAGLNELSDGTCYAWHPQNVGQAYSALTWATGYMTQPFVNPTQNGQKAELPELSSIASQNWDIARGSFHNALISTSTADRDADFAWTFRSLGQVLHLLQDMAVPAHVRNDFLNNLNLNLEDLS